MYECNVKVVFENYNVVHTDGVKYTRVRGRDCKVWIPINELPPNPVNDGVYEIMVDTFERYRAIRR